MLGEIIHRTKGYFYFKTTYLRKTRRNKIVQFRCINTFDFTTLVYNNSQSIISIKRLKRNQNPFNQRIVKSVSLH